MKDLSLRSKLVFGGILIVVIPLVIVGTVTFINSYRTLEDISKVQMVQIAKSLSNMIQIAIEKELTLLATTAKDPAIIDGASRQAYNGLAEKLADLYNKMGMDYEGLAIIDQNAIVRVDAVDKRRVGISVAEREYLKSARQGKTGIGPVNTSKATGRPVFGMVAPIMSSEGRYLGCVLGVLKADFLVKHNLSLKLGQTGYAFMVDQQGLVIAHPEPAYILKLNMLAEPELRENAERMIRRETGTAEYTYQGIRKIMGFTPIELTGWSVAVTQDKNEVMALAYANRNLILLVSGLFLLMTIIAVFFLSGTISLPVQKTLTTLNQAIEQATEAIIIIGLDKRVQFANPAMAKIIDRPVQDFIGEILNFENINIYSEEIWKNLEKGRLWKGCITGTRKDRTDYSLDMTVTPVRDGSGKISCFLAIGKDISRELMMEIQLRQSQKMEAIGTLAGGIAHDFNNILSAIMGYTDMALAKPGLDNSRRHYLEQVFKAGGRAKDLVKQILTFSRQQEQERKPVLIAPIIKEGIKLLRSSLPTTINITQNITDEQIMVLADPTQMHQVLMNLCTNASHAMRESGGVLGIQLFHENVISERTLSPLTLARGIYAKLTVSDTGHGIDATIIDKIFDPFFTSKAPGEGTGLGLSVVYGIIRDHGGAIEVSSEPGMGTTVTCYFPIIETEEILQEQTHESIPGGSERILFIDDEEALVELGSMMLTSLGYQVTSMTSSLDALKAFRSHPYSFDLVITDMTMPNMRGDHLAMEILKIRPDIPIVLCTGFSEMISEDKAKDLGIRQLIMKPISMNNLASEIRKVLSVK